MSDAIKLFVGSSSNCEDNMIEIAYDYSLRKNTYRELDIIWMRQTYDKNSFWHGWNS